MEEVPGTGSPRELKLQGDFTGFPNPAVSFQIPAGFLYLVENISPSIRAVHKESM